MNKYITDSGVELDLTVEQAFHYSKLSNLTLVGVADEKEKTKVVREVKAKES